MNLFAILSFLSFLISLFLGAYVLIKAPEKKINVIFFIFSLLASALCFIEFEFRIAESIDRAVLWSKIQSLWPFVLAISLHFVIEIKEIKKRKNLIYILIYVPAIVIFLIDLQTNLITAIPTNVPWGWSLQRQNNIVGYFAAAWAGIVLLLSVYLPYKYYLEFSGVKKKQVFLILLAFVINLVFALITDVISPFLNLVIPELSNTLSIIPFAIIAFAMWKYQLFEINPNSLIGKLLMTLNDSVFLTNSKQEIIEVNEAGIAMLNYQSNELIGKKIDFIIHKTSEQILSVENISKILKSDINDIEINFCSKNGKVIPVSISLSETSLNNKNKFGYILVARDISARKQAADDLKNAFNKLDDLVAERTGKLTKVNRQLIISTEKAKESDRLKSAFLANMSHEIRTPMNGILGFAGLLKEPNLSGELQQNYIKIIEKSGDRMLNIINDIVSISKIESGLVDMNIKELNINSQQDYLYTFFKPEADAKKIVFSFNSSLNLKQSIIKTDQDKFMSIYTNLIKNALKYTEEGSIEFGYNKKDDFLEFYIKDTGIGIESDRQEAIFERFIQADIEDKMARQGAGLGLSITKAYVEMLGGKIWLESIKGIGSSFYFTIPYINEPVNCDNNSSDVFERKIENSIKDFKILLVEDDETSALLMGLMLDEINSEILRAKNGFEAIDLCRKNPDIDLVLMDIRMPEMDGYEATRKIRQFNKDVIIVAQTAHALSGDIEKSIAVGCNDHVTKPIIKNELFTVINSFLFNKE